MPNDPSDNLIDLDYLNDFAGNDAETMKELIDIFMEHAPQLVADLKQFCDSRDAQKLQRAAHKMKPMLAYVGMNTIRMRVTRIEEEDIAEDKWDQVATEVGSICDDFEVARARLTEFRNGMRS